MRTVSSYGAEIRKPNIPLRLTMKTYRQGSQLPDRDLHAGMEELVGDPGDKAF